MRYRYAILAGTIGLSWFSLAHAQTPSDYIFKARLVAKNTANIDAALTQIEAKAYGIRIPKENHESAKATVESTLLANRIALKAEGVFSEPPKGLAIKKDKSEKPKVVVKELYSSKIPGNAKEWKKLGLDFNKAKVRKGKYYQRLKNGWEVEYTVKPKAQAKIRSTLQQAHARRGAVVLINPKTGSVEAMVGVDSSRKLDYHMVTRADAPSASVFKIITASALLSEGYQLDAQTCYHGGRSYLSERNIKGDKKRDHKCATLTSALAFSINSIFAKLAYRSLTRVELSKAASKFAYDQNIPFEFEIARSRTTFPRNKIERARAAAGFRHSKLSPLHSSLIAASIANHGRMMKPFIVKRVRDKSGKVIHRSKPQLLKRVTSANIAERLWKSMQETTKRGTARKYFRKNNFSIASGKTGTLSDQSPYTQYSWFAGSAEKAGKRVAVGALICNPEKWRIKGGYAASQALRSYFSSL